MTLLRVSFDRKSVTIVSVGTGAAQSDLRDSYYGARMGKHASHDALREMDAAYAAFIQELRDKHYSENAIDTYDKTVSRFLRWAEGSFVPQGPRK
jgi:glucose-6-phosphate isomerase